MRGMTIYGPGQVDPIPPDPAEPSAKPTKKLLGAAITAALLYGVSLVTDLDPQLEQAANVIGPLVAGWIIRNDPTPGGVPRK
jgi:hypothetical protein